MALSRRRFLAGVSAAAAAWGISAESLGRAVAAPLRAADIPTTVQQTIRMSSQPVRGSYRTLLSGPGEAFIARYDVLGRVAEAGRASARRSLFYFAHLTDIHIIDAQSPARMDAMEGLAPETFADASRPQDTLTTHVLSAMVDSVAHAQTSGVTGAPLAAAVSTGDSADNLSCLETDWYITMLDGGEITPNSGAAGVYEGPQAWPESTFCYHPGDPSIDLYGAYGFPTLPDLLTQAVSNPVRSQGLPVPWYAVFGNHDSMYMGTFRADPELRLWAIGDRKAATGEALAGTWVDGLAATGSVLQRGVNGIRQWFGLVPGLKSVTSDPARKLLEGTEFMQAHVDSPAVPGPPGHGWSQADVDAGRTYWRADVTAYLTFFGLDTCNLVAGADGAVPQSQFDWLQSGLAQCQSEGRLAMVFSHHNSTTLENTSQPVFSPSEGLVHAEEFISMLQQYPACIAWVNGHTHINMVQAHIKEGGTGGFWEITAASCVDYPQQQQLLEIVDNRDGTMSIFATALDHDSDAAWTVGDYSQKGMASLSRELAANHWYENPPMRQGTPLDRNVELLLPAPFDLSAVTDAALETERMKATARLQAHGGAA